MAEIIQRSRGRPKSYKFDRGGYPAEFGPFTGIVMSTYDNTRSGRLRVFIPAFNGPANQINTSDAYSVMQDESKWTTVSYMPPFFGSTPPPPSSGSTNSVGAYPGNPNSYGMWFTPPDIGVTVICIFVNGDRSQGYYIGVAPDETVGHMVPAIGASSSFELANANQQAYFDGAIRLPVSELNVNNDALYNSPRFYNVPKPVHSYQAQTMFQQGLIKDGERGPITSSSQRESPSAVFGISTPGTPIYQGGLKPNDIRRRIDAGEVSPQDVNVIGRVSGHSFVMDDGNLDGDNSLIRLRTSKGHQITMSDSGNFFYITHANGQTWLEFGVEGTVDVYSSNSVNVRTKGDINLHADRDINMYAGREVNIKSEKNMHLESMVDTIITAQQNFTAYSKGTIGVKADGTLTLNSASGSWGAGSAMKLQAGAIDLNGPAADKVTAPNPITKTLFDDTTFDNSTGWEIQEDGLTSIVSRAPTHEPYPYHNRGVDVVTAFETGQPSPPPGAVPVPAGVEIIVQG
jgi:hypothetical protein